MKKRGRQARGRRTRRTWAPVVDLSSVRAQKRRELAERRVRSALDENRAALARLFGTGLIFTQKGARAGRDLLSAHQSLLKAVFEHLDAQLARTAQLSARTGEFVAGRGRD